MRGFVRTGLIILLLGAAFAARAQTNGLPPVVIDYFYEPGCPACRAVADEVLPALESRFPGFYRLEARDLSLMSNMLLLVAFQERLGLPEKSEPVSMVVDATYAFNGVEAIRVGLLDRVERSIAERLDPAWRAPEPIRVERGRTAGAAAARAGTFALLAVVAGGLTDGLNPCAMTTLVFFMSLLALARVRGRDMILMGACFCLASFAVYTALGVGLLRVAHALDVFPAARSGLRAGMMAALALLALLSFRDAWRFRRSGRAADVTLRLPDSLTRRIHGVMRSRLKAGGLAVGGLAAGGLVTLIESVCTGQVYLPTLMVVLGGGLGTAREWLLLVLYNLMVIVPLAVVFVLAFCGLKSDALAAWGRAHVVPGKILLGVFFLALMLGMVLM